MQTSRSMLEYLSRQSSPITSFLKTCSLASACPLSQKARERIFCLHRNSFFSIRGFAMLQQDSRLPRKLLKLILAQSLNNGLERNFGNDSNIPEGLYTICVPKMVPRLTSLSNTKGDMSQWKSNGRSIRLCLMPGIY